MVPHILAYIRGGLWGRNAGAERFTTPSPMSGGIAEVAALKRTVRKRPKHSHFGALTFSLLNAHLGSPSADAWRGTPENAFRSPLLMPLETNRDFGRTFTGEVRVKRDETPLETVAPLLDGLSGPVDPRNMARKLGISSAEVSSVPVSR